MDSPEKDKQTAWDMAEDTFRKMAIYLGMLAIQQGKAVQDNGIILAAHAGAVYKLLLSSSLFLRHYEGKFTEIKSFAELEDNKEVLRSLIEDILVMIERAMSGYDPDFDYAISILKKEKK